MLGKRVKEYADIPNEFNDAESARFFVLFSYAEVGEYLIYYCLCYPLAREF